ncbi:MAG: 50S ribosomal protein L25 [Desulfobulbaceae bacterium]|jgi:large subunit ribosomal protein L25|nr:50S ribosomal protein L25 [Desulfobulbaceae bacterium]
MIQVSIPGVFRSGFGKGAARQLRMKELTPAVVYSGGTDAVPLQLNSTVLHRNLLDIHGRNSIVTLQIEGDEKGERHTLVKEIQKNPVTDELVHVDFFEIALDKPTVFTVPLKFAGTAKGVDLGGELHIARNSVRLKGLPLDIPDIIEVGIRNLGRGDSLTLGELSLPDKVEMLDDPARLCVSIS